MTLRGGSGQYHFLNADHVVHDHRHEAHYAGRCQYFKHWIFQVAQRVMWDQRRGLQETADVVSFDHMEPRRLDHAIMFHASNLEGRKPATKCPIVGSLHRRYARPLL